MSLTSVTIWRTLAFHRVHGGFELVAGHGPFLQELQVAAGGHQWSPQFVRHVGQELAAGQFLLG